VQSIALQVGGYRLVISFDRADLEDDVNDQSREPYDVKAKRVVKRRGPARTPALREQGSNRARSHPNLCCARFLREIEAIAGKELEA
jgi:hypothetical protein